MTPAEASLNMISVVLGSEPSGESICLAIQFAKDAVAFADGATWLGQGRFRVGGETIVIEGRRAVVIETLVILGAADKPELERTSRCGDAVQLLREVVRLYPQLAPYITRPGARGRGGYSTTIVDRRQ
jgi:hypothetical protein